MPRLEKLYFYSRPNGHDGREFVAIAPSVGIFTIITAEFPTDPMLRWNIYQSNALQGIFVHDDKRFRTFAIPPHLIAFTWPGPKFPLEIRTIWK